MAQMPASHIQERKAASSIDLSFLYRQLCRKLTCACVNSELHRSPCLSTISEAASST